MESQHTLRIKWFHIIFFIVLCFCIQTVFGCSCSCVNKQKVVASGGSVILTCRHIAWRKGKCAVSHVTVNVSQPVSHLNMAVVLFFLLLLQRNSYISSIKAKRAVNRMHCVVQMVIGRALSESPHRDIKAMQIASLSLRAVCFCHKWVCDIGTPFYIKQIHQNDNGGTPSED